MLDNIVVKESEGVELIIMFKLLKNMWRVKDEDWLEYTIQKNITERDELLRRLDLIEELIQKTITAQESVRRDLYLSMTDESDAYPLEKKLSELERELDYRYYDKKKVRDEVQLLIRRRELLNDFTEMDIPVDEMKKQLKALK